MTYLLVMELSLVVVGEHFQKTLQKRFKIYRASANDASTGDEAKYCSRGSFPENFA